MTRARRAAAPCARPADGTAAARLEARQLRLSEAAPAGAPDAPPFSGASFDWTSTDDGMLAVFDGRPTWPARGGR